MTLLFYPVVERGGCVWQSKKKRITVQSVRSDCGNTCKKTGQCNLWIYGKQLYCNVRVTELFRLEGTSWGHLLQLQLFFVQWYIMVKAVVLLWSLLKILCIYNACEESIIKVFAPNNRKTSLLNTYFSCSPTGARFLTLSPSPKRKWGKIYS